MPCLSCAPKYAPGPDIGNSPPILIVLSCADARPAHSVATPAKVRTTSKPRLFIGPLRSDQAVSLSMNLWARQSRRRTAPAYEVALGAAATVDCSASIGGGSRRDGNIRGAESRMLAAALRVEGEPLQCTPQGGIFDSHPGRTPRSGPAARSQLAPHHRTCRPGAAHRFAGGPLASSDARPRHSEFPSAGADRHREADDRRVATHPDA